MAKVELLLGDDSGAEVADGDRAAAAEIDRVEGDGAAEFEAD